MEILILGHTGLLGSMVKLYFEYENIKFEVLPSNLRWGDDSFKNYIQSKNG